METRYSMLKGLRKKYKVTQKFIAEILEIRTNVYQGYEYGNRELPIKHAKRLGRFFQFDWWLLYED